MTKLHDELNKINPHLLNKLPFRYGKAKVSESSNLWAGKWKTIVGVDDGGKRFSLEGRGFDLNEIDEVKFSREGMIKILERMDK